MTSVKVRLKNTTEDIPTTPIKALKGFILGAFSEIVSADDPELWQDLQEIVKIWNARVLPEQIDVSLTYREVDRKFGALRNKIGKIAIDLINASPDKTFQVKQIYGSRDNPAWQISQYSDETITARVRELANKKLFEVPLLVNLEHGGGKYSINPEWIKKGGDFGK